MRREEKRGWLIPTFYTSKTGGLSKDTRKDVERIPHRLECLDRSSVVGQGFDSPILSVNRQAWRQTIGFTISVSHPLFPGQIMYNNIFITKTNMKHISHYIQNKGEGDIVRERRMRTTHSAASGKLAQLQVVCGVFVFRGLALSPNLSPLTTEEICTKKGGLINTLQKKESKKEKKISRAN